VWVGSYIGSRLQVTWLNNWVSVPGRVGYFHLSKASRWHPIHLVLGAHYRFGNGIIYVFFRMCVRYVCVFFCFQKEFKNLKNLDLFNNEATSIDNYREKVFLMIPSLKYLDG
jgi:hypothetical protein